MDVVLDQYFDEDSIKAQTRSKLIGKKISIRRLTEGQQIPFPHVQVWSQFITLDANKADLANFLSAVIVEMGKWGAEPPQNSEIVTGDRFTQAEETR